MSLPTLYGTGRLVADPEAWSTTNGTLAASLRLAFNSRKRNDAGEWEDGDQAFIRATVWGALGGAVVRDLRKGDEVLVSGELRTVTWNDKETGAQRSALELTVREIGASPRSAKVTVAKLTRQVEPVGK